MTKKGKNRGNRKEKKKQAHVSNTNNNRTAKKNNKKKNLKACELEEYLIKRGLRVKYMLPDGNCFFRALGDQLNGTDKCHMEIRENVMTYIEENREIFEPFVEACLDEGETFENYINDLKKESMWAGEFEVHAASLLYNVDICIYQMTGDTVQCLCNKNPMAKKTIHISYHDGEHYNSVRNKDDYSDTKPNDINIVNTTNIDTNDDDDDNKKKVEDVNWTWRDEKRVMEETGCMNDKLIYDTLKKYDGNVISSINEICDWMIEHGESSDIQRVLAEENNPLSMSVSMDDLQDEVEYEREVVECKYDGSNDDVKKFVRNKTKCPCGSGKKYKSCCKLKEKKLERMKQDQAEAVAEMERKQETSKKLENDVKEKINLITI